MAATLEALRLMADIVVRRPDQPSTYTCKCRQTTPLGKSEKAAGRAARRRRYIGRGHAENIRQGFSHANGQGTPLNVAVTIYWGKADGRRPWSEHQQEIFERLKNWLRYRGLPARWAWVAEQPGLAPSIHSHWVVHVPKEHRADFEAWLRTQGFEGDDTAVKVKPAYNGSGWMKYMLKGMAPTDYQRFFNTSKRPAAQGLIEGKRCGLSRDIDQKARARRLAPRDAVVIDAADLFGPVEVEGWNAWRKGLVPPSAREAVERRRRAFGLTQDTLASRIGISRPQLVNALHGRFGLSGPPTENLKEFLTGDGARAA